MVSHSSHTNHEFLILVIRVTNVSFAIKSFVSYEKGLIMLHEEDFPTSKILVIFLFFCMTNLLQVMRGSAKNRSGKCDQIPQKLQ